ncbi:hypothetical protein FKM82_028386 [Ascaphus truei]
MDNPATEGKQEQNPEPECENPESILANLIVPPLQNRYLDNLTRACRGTFSGNHRSRRKHLHHQRSPKNSPLDHILSKIQGTADCLDIHGNPESDELHAPLGHLQEPVLGGWEQKRSCCRHPPLGETHGRPKESLRYLVAP